MEKLNFARAARRRKMERLFDLVTRVHNDESGQGLVEYLLIVALVALAATAGMSSAASYINSAFIRIGGKLGQYVS
jgi:Flp pilus assembly pilin Flp